MARARRGREGVKPSGVLRIDVSKSSSADLVMLTSEVSAALEVNRRSRSSVTLVCCTLSASNAACRRA